MDKTEFRLIKDFGSYKKGQVFNNYGGVVHGIECEDTNQTMRFDDKEYFEIVV
jgi:hypothetical protein